MISWTVYIRTVSEANSSEHWTIKNRRHKQQQFFVNLSYKENVKEIKLPCVITLTRLSPRLLDDDDNLPMAFKWIKDELGACIFPEKVVEYTLKKKKIQNKGHADSDPRIKWQYKQEKNPISSVCIEIESL